MIHLPAAATEPGGVRGRFAASWRDARRTWRNHPSLIRSLARWGGLALGLAAGTTAVLAPGAGARGVLTAVAVQLGWMGLWWLLIALHLGLTHRPGGPLERRIGLPNGLTSMRVLLVPTLSWAILAHPRLTAHAEVAVTLIFLVGFSDVLDGFLARALHLQTVLGRYLDHGADVLICTGAALAEYLAGLMPGWLLGLYLLRYPGTGLVAVVGLALRPDRGIQPSWVGKGTTLVAGAALFVMIAQPLLSPGTPPWMTWVHRATGAVVAINCVALIFMVVTGRAFTRKPLAADAPGEATPAGGAPDARAPHDGIE